MALDQEQLFPVGPSASSGKAGPTVLVAGDDRTGRAIGTVNPPRGFEFESVQGGSDDRTFVVMATGQARPGVPPYTWYLLRLAPGTAHPDQLTKLPIKLPGGVADVGGYAVSPDGKSVAIETLDHRAGKAGTTLAIYSLSSGARLRAWTASTDITEGLAADTLTWLSTGRQLVFSDLSLEKGTIAAEDRLRTIDLSGAGSDLLADSRPLLTLSSPNSHPATCWTLEATPDGRTALCGTENSVLTSGGTSAGCAAGGLRLIAYSVRTGRPVRVLYRYTGACKYGYATVLWAGAAARDSIVALEFEAVGPAAKQGGLLGVVSDGRLRPLPLAKSVPAAAYANVAF